MSFPEAFKLADSATKHGIDIGARQAGRIQQTLNVRMVGVNGSPECTAFGMIPGIIGRRTDPYASVSAKIQKGERHP